MAEIIMPQEITTEAEWLKARLDGIGASEASAIVGQNPYMSNVDLWMIKTGRKKAPDISSNAHVEYGHAAEGPIRELFALDYPEYEVTYGGAFDMVRNEKYPWLFATLDGRLIERETGVESRATILGHVQRGGSPTVNDRVLASRMGNYATRLLRDDCSSRVVAIKNDTIVDYDIEEALQMEKEIDIDIYRMAHEISI